MLQETTVDGAEFVADSTHFHISEFQALHAEINVKLNNIEQNVRFMMGGLTAIWAWLLTQHYIESRPLSLLPYLPLVFTILFGAVIFRQMRYVLVQGRYLELVEQRYAAPGLGWEEFRNETDRTGEWRVHKLTIILLFLLQAGVVFWSKSDTFPFKPAIDWILLRLPNS